MLSLSDPLWRKLDDAHRDRDIPKLLSELAETWDDEEAISLFWDCLCHQETCYGATYAVVPHLLNIARPDKNVHQRREIALFLGFVALCAFEYRAESRGGPDERSLEGLPETVDAWDRKLDTYRSLVTMLEAPDLAVSQYERNELLPLYRWVLETDAVDERDLEKIRAIKFEFFNALPEIRALCEHAFIECLQDEHAPRYLLSGVAAADGLFGLARLLQGGTEGAFSCASCHWQFEFMLFGDKVAFYADEDPPGAFTVQPASDKDRLLKDYNDGTSVRSDGFISPIEDRKNVADKRAAALFELAYRASAANLALLLRNYLGSFVCTNCGVEGKVTSL